MRKKHLLVMDAGFESARWMGRLFSSVEIFKSINQIGKQTVLVLEGGQDISPSHYGQGFSRLCQPTNWARDNREVAAFRAAMHAGAGVVGICRGAQLVTALSGGKLFQHVEGHHGDHYMETIDGQTIVTTSHHHQMMNPYVLPDAHYSILAWSPEPLSDCYLSDKNKTEEIPDKEPEIVWYNRSQSLAIQGHPEWADPKGAYVGYCKSLIQQLL